jgi:putative salt-induced outer membrane protein YdiY
MITRKQCRSFVALAAFVCIQPFVATAQDDKSALDNKRAVDNKTVTQDTGTSATGTGNYSRLPFHVTVGLRGGYDDNVLTTTVNPQGSWFTNLNIGLSYKAGNPRTQIDLAAGGGITYYYDHPGERDYDLNANLSLAITHKATPRLTLAASMYATYQVDPGFDINVGLNRRSGNYFYTTDRFSVAYQWAPRFSTVTSYTFGAVKYENSNVGAIEDRFEHTFGNEFRFLLLPTTSLIGEYRFMVEQYEDAPRDSTSHFLLAGVDHSFSPRFSISARGGVEFRNYDDAGSRSSPYFEGTLDYALNQRTTIRWTNRYSIEEPDVAVSQSRKTFRTGLQATYGATARITATAGLFYQHDDNESFARGPVATPAFTEDSISLALGIRYAITRNFALEAGYNHTEVLSDIALREYSRNRYFIGGAFSF